VLLNDPATRKELARLTLSEWALGDVTGIDPQNPQTNLRDALAGAHKLIDLIGQISTAHEEHLRGKKKKG
jgi:hypothetical protein